MSERSFSRHYAEATGLTPGRAVERLRVEAARRLLSESRLPVKRISQRCGFGSEETMRRSFLRLLAARPKITALGSADGVDAAAGSGKVAEWIARIDGCPALARYRDSAAVSRKRSWTPHPPGTTCRIRSSCNGHVLRRSKCGNIWNNRSRRSPTQQFQRKGRGSVRSS